MNLKQIASPNRRWEGYNFEELRAQRTLCAARIMIERNNLARETDRLRAAFTERDRTMKSTLLGRMVSALNYMDWMVLGINIFRHLAPLFRRK